MGAGLAAVGAGAPSTRGSAGGESPCPGCARVSAGEQRSVGSDSVTPWTVAARLLCPRDSPGRNTIGVGSHSLLQGIFPTQGWNVCLLPWWAGSFPPAPPGKQGCFLFCCPGWRLQGKQRGSCSSELAFVLLVFTGLLIIGEFWETVCAMPPVLTRCRDSPPVHNATQPRWSPYLNDRHRTCFLRWNVWGVQALSACFPTPGYPGQGLPEPHPAPKGRRVPVPCRRRCPPASRRSLTPPPGWLDTPCPVPRGGSPGPGQSPGHKHDC